jgi:ankyrin repeat protein
MCELMYQLLILFLKTTQTQTDLNEMEMDFLDAVNNGSLHDVKRFVEQQGVNVNVKGLNGWSAIICTGNTGRVDVLQFLLDKGAEVNGTTNEGASALMAATSEGHIEIMKMLLEAGAKVDQQNHNGKTVLHYAVGLSRIEAAEMLLDYGANLQIENRDGDTPLDVAVSDQVKENIGNYNPLNSLHKKLNASNRQVEDLRKEVHMLKNFVLATCIGSMTIKQSNSA